MKYVVNYLQGLVMGIAEIIPGVSGSTLALAMGIYEKFLDLLHEIVHMALGLLLLLIRKKSWPEFKEQVKKLDWSFAIPLGLGTLTGLGLFAHLITVLLDNYPQYIFAVFFGLIAASVIFPWQRMKTHGLSDFIIILVSTVLTFLVLGLKPAEISGTPSLLLLFVGGILGISGMVLPGVSGSFILLMLGLYDYILGLVKGVTRLRLESGILELVTFIAGLVIGFTVFIKFLKYMLKYHTTKFMAVLIGIMIGSLRVPWPFMRLSADLGASEHPKVLPWDVPVGEMVVILLLVVVSGFGIIFLRRISDQRSSAST